MGLLRGGEPQLLGAGDYFVVAANAPCTLSTDPTLSPDPGLDVCMTEVGGVAEVGDGEATCVEGGQVVLDHAGWQLLSVVLPGVVVVPAAAAEQVDLGSALHRFFSEAGSTEPGAALAATRLGELVCLAALRQVLGDESAAPRGWLAAVNDPTVGPATRALYADLGRPWSVSALAGLVHLHPSTFATRFREVTGDSPAAFLASARMRAAAVRPRSTDTTLEHLATQLGYSSEASFSRAFRRTHGTSPGRCRADRSGTG